ncbi:MAG TPA: ABC transporter ATP-binding protein, partial [Longimicrobiales bacterium]
MTEKRRITPSAAWREARQLAWEHRRHLALGFVLMLIGRLAGLVLPLSPRYLIDDVIGRHRPDLLFPLAAAVAGATLLQGLTSFALSQVVSIAGQRAIAELRKEVQAHVLRLPVRYFDTTQTGVLITRV